MNRKLIYITCVAMMACSSSVKEKEADFDFEGYKKEVEEWQQKRNAFQVSENGWVNLAGLFWLKEGINTFGSGEDNDLVFPKGKIPEHAGFLLLDQNVIKLEGAPGVEFTINDRKLNSAILSHPDSSRVTAAYGPLRWFVIRRGGEFGIRLRDLEHPLLKEFYGIEFYTIDPAWRIKGRVEWADSSRTIEITNVLGQTGPQRSVGTLVFDYRGKEYRLEALDEGNKEFFIIFGDDTNARETYGAGRYMYVPVPEKDNVVIIDFNRAYNPPCAFTEFATCPLPPQQNVLPFAIPAGEKNYGTH
jgi:uncharacterized protein